MDAEEITYYRGRPIYGYSLDVVIRDYLANTPVDDSLPVGWEVRFGKRGRFMKYDDIEHVERKHMYTFRETGITVPFGNCNSSWERMKAQAQAGDEFWMWGNSGTAVLLVRDNEIISELAVGFIL